MAVHARLLATAAIVVSLAAAPAVHAEHWHGGRHYEHHGGGGAAGAAIIGGLVGLGVVPPLLLVAAITRRHRRFITGECLPLIMRHRPLSTMAIATE